MRIDLPYCGFKNCRYYFDGNCTKPSKQEKCEYWYILHEEPEPKKGHWIKMTDDSGRFASYFCSRCGTQEGKPTDTCPNCGADMRGEEK